MSEANIYQRINEVMRLVEYVQKDASVQGYKAVSHDQVISVIRKAMVKAGIVVRLEQLKGEFVQMRDLSKDIKMHLYSADYAVHFVNIEKPDDCCSVTINAHAADTGDKAPCKAASYAVKYAILKTFSLETGESDESRTHEEPQFTDIQKEVFDAVMEGDDALAYVCFSKSVGHEVMSALTKTFPSGKISQGKAKQKKMESEGWAILKDSAAAIKAAIENNDSDGLLETVAELEPIERKLVAGMLSPAEIKAIKDVQELSA